MHNDRDLWLERAFEEARASFEAGVDAALVDALALCRSQPDTVPPRWVLDAVYDRALEQFLQKGAKGYRQRMAVHFDRWATASYVRRKQEAFRLKKDQQYPVHQILRSSEVLSRTGVIFDHIFEAASRFLRGTPARGSARAVRESYNEVQRDMKAGKSALYYVPVSDEVRGLLDSEARSIPIANTAPWYDPERRAAKK
jgi:hypothetical protein